MLRNHSSISIIVIFLVFVLNALGQKQVKYADDFLLKDNRRPSKVMLLGIWHFDYPNLDSHKADKGNMVDVLEPRRQKEIADVIAILKKYNPTKICLEAYNQQQLDKRYESYKKGELKTSREEIDQLGLRLAAELNLEKVYAVDATNYAQDNAKKNTEINGLWDEKYQLDAAKYEEYDKAFNEWHDYSDSLLKSQTILEHIVYINDSRNLKRSYGQYMVSGWLKTSNNNGPDALALQWYNRNLRIFNNIMKTGPGLNDRVLVIFGKGHIPLLQHSFEASPEFELVSFEKLASKKK